MNPHLGSPDDEHARRHLAAIVESSDDAIISKDLNGIITSWNAGAQQLYGYTAEEVVGRPVSMLAPEERKNEIPAIMDRLRRGERVNHYKTVRQAKDGRRLNISLTISPIRDSHGGLVGASVIARDLTASQQTERTLARIRAEAEQRRRLYETIISSTPDLVYAFDLNYRFTYANAALLAMWGRGWDDAIGKNLLEIGYEPWHAEMHERELDQVVAAKKPVRGEVPFPHHQLGERIYDYIFVPVLDSSGEVEAIIGTTRDVTERKQTEQALRRSEEQRRVALMAAEMGTWDYDVSTGLLHWDQRTAGFFGMKGRDFAPLEEVVARIHEDDRTEVRRQIEAAINPADDGRYDIEYRVSSEGREQRWIRAVGQVLFEGEGRRRRATRFVGIVSDTTQARAARETLREANEPAEHHLAQLQAVLTQMTEGLVIADPQGHVQSMNEAALAIHDLARPEDVRRHLRQYTEGFELFRIEDHEPLPVDQWPLAQALRGETFTGQEVRIRNTHSGRTWIGSYGGTPVYDAQGRVQLAIVTVRDVTQRKQAEQRLHELNATLEQRVAERTAQAEQRADQLQRLAGEMTEVEQRERRRLARLLHDDLQQLLVAAKLRLKTTASAGAVDQARTLLTQAIDTSRSLTTELAPPVLYDFGLNAALEWIVRWARDRYQLNVELASDGSESSEGEQLRALLFEAVRELLLNIVKHAKVDEARIHLQRAQGRLCIAVEDQGIGFDPAARRSNHDRSGYGLFSLQERLELLGGQVQVDSAPDKGTRVQITVPLPTADHAPAAEPSVEPRRKVQPSAEPAATPRTRVLLTDDHQVVRQGLAHLLKQHPGMAIVAEAASGEEAVGLTREHRPDVVVMDISLPGISGVEATRQIMADFPQTCVIGLSMHEEDDVADAMRAAGARAYLNKSEAAEKLFKAIQRFSPVGCCNAETPA